MKHIIRKFERHEWQRYTLRISGEPDFLLCVIDGALWSIALRMGDSRKIELFRPPSSEDAHFYRDGSYDWIMPSMWTAHERTIAKLLSVWTTSYEDSVDLFDYLNMVLNG